jgi:hypothetical protein
VPSRASRRTRAHAAWWRTGRLHAGCARAPRRASASGAARADGIDAIVPRPSDTRDRARSGYTVFSNKQKARLAHSPMSVCLASGVLGANRERDGRDFAGSGLETQKKNAPRASATPEKSEARSVRAFSLLATSRRRPIEERSRTLGVTHKRHSENGLRRPRKARFFVSDASPRALHDARTRRATLPQSGRPTPVTPALARSRRTSARTRTRTPRVRPLRE